jgi:hypothetical protein
MEPGERWNALVDFHQRQQASLKHRSKQSRMVRHVPSRAGRARTKRRLVDDPTGAAAVLAIGRSFRMSCI